MINRIVVHTNRRAERSSAVRAAHKHYVGSSEEAGRLHAGEHVNIVIGARPRPVHRHVNLPGQSFGIYRVAGIYVATQVDGRGVIKGRRYGRVLCVAGTDAPNLVRGGIHAANEQIAVRIHVERAPNRRVRNKNRIHPRDPAVSRTAELPAAVIVTSGTPALVLESVSAAARVVYREPLLVATCCGTDSRPGLTARDRPPDIVKKCLEKTEIEK